ncbi:hypothetical protein MANES_03G154200v8 [Manihot esculenta]|uniref:S-protein homolog n=1 Tax=Manihot esculenta TaxID=3983 RepID=A0A2C9WAA3_MANES|nr:hypothetical protein MANES_03G154200v8 [Manihot esculenta]
MWAQIMLLMLVMSSVSGATGFILQKKRTINITNELGTNNELRLHCKSKNDDLGEQLLPYKGFWYFKFRPNFWGTTDFYCSMSWEQVSHSFDIYVDSRDDLKCFVCQWIIQATGPCLWNKDTQQFDICFPWNE